MSTSPAAGPWLPLLANLQLSRTEREVVRRFEADPAGRTFLPVADILRAHRLVDESLELLTAGVERHPSFTVARVVLARELLQKGLVEAAWRVLEDSPVPLRDNLLAQKLRFRLAVLLGDESVVRATYQHLKQHQMLDAESRKLGDMLEVTGLPEARATLIKDLRDRGTELVMPAAAAPEAGDPPAPAPGAGAAAPGQGRGSAAAAAVGAGVDVDAGPGGADAGVPAGGAAAGAPTVSPYFRDDQLEADLAGFHVVPLDEIFRPGDQGGAPRGAKGGIELDSTTLADIYARQGHYGKALEVYRRLLRLTPNNDLLRRKVAELSKLEREQRVTDLAVDPALVDRMETVEIIDRQIKFFNELLSRLS